MLNNEVRLEGNLVRDVEVKATSTGKTVARFTVACQKPKRKDGADGGADFVDCIAWEQQAEIIGNNFKKGERVYVIGHYTTNSYQKQDGTKVYQHPIVVERVYKPLFANTKGNFEQFGKVESEPIPF